MIPFPITGMCTTTLEETKFESISKIMEQIEQDIMTQKMQHLI